jgi:hypothetical protein
METTLVYLVSKINKNVQKKLLIETGRPCQRWLIFLSFGCEIQIGCKRKKRTDLII